MSLNSSRAHWLVLLQIHELWPMQRTTNWCHYTKWGPEKLHSALEWKTCTTMLTTSVFQTKRPWRREWLPTPVFLPGKAHGPRSLVGYSPWSCKELDMTERLTLFPHTFTFILNDRYWFTLWIYSQKIKSTLKMVIFSPQDLRVFSSQYCFWKQNSSLGKILIKNLCDFRVSLSPHRAQGTIYIAKDFFMSFLPNTKFSLKIARNTRGKIKSKTNTPT